jgi:hypothetical protein
MPTAFGGSMYHEPALKHAGRQREKWGIVQKQIFAVVKSGVLYQDDYFKKLA